MPANATAAVHSTTPANAMDTHISDLEHQMKEIFEDNNALERRIMGCKAADGIPWQVASPTQI